VRRDKIACGVFHCGACIKLFITRYAVAPKRLSASGYGEYDPVASNENAEGRAMNRRVDLVILKFQRRALPRATSANGY
jgi:hypothetical protein